MIPAAALGLLTNRWTVLAIAVAGACLVAYHLGAKSVYEDWVEANEIAAAAARAVVVRQNVVTEKIVEKWRTRTVQVKGDTETITKEIVRYVPASADPVLPRGWLLLHDAAATRAVPAAAGGADVAAPAVAASQALQGVVGNYGTCHAIAEQLTGLQDWVRQQYETMNLEALR